MGPLLGVVFAGGRSVRMGRDKALMPWPPGAPDGVPLVVRAARALGARCQRVEVAAGGSDSVAAAVSGPGGDSWALVADAREGAGPLSALVASLERARELGLEGVLVLACDVPLIEAPDLDPLLEAFAGGADAALWTTRDTGDTGDTGGATFDHPLVAVYRTTAAVPARAALERGARRVVALFEEAASTGRPLNEKRLLADQKSAFRLVNVNTPSDYDQAGNEVRSEGTPGRLVPHSDVRADSGPLPETGPTHGRPSIP